MAELTNEKRTGNPIRMIGSLAPYANVCISFISSLSCRVFSDPSDPRACVFSFAAAAAVARPK